MAKKNNKTDHVLNLLSGAEEQDEAIKAEEINLQIVNQNEDTSIADSVEQLLEEELIEEEKLLGEQREKEKALNQVEEVVENNMAEEAVVDNKISEEKNEDRNNSESEEYKMVNVMEEIVEKKLDNYIKKFNVCNCSRCRADIKALTLTNLSAKYVVMNKRGISAFLSFYSNKYLSEVMSQLAKSCMQVSNEPRH